MAKKNLFFKKSYIKNNYLYIFFLTFIFLIFFYSLKLTIFNTNFVSINPINYKFYEILENSEGKIIPDYGISILENNSYNNSESIKTKLDKKYKYSIQLFASSEHLKSINKRDQFIKILNILPEDLLIVELNTNLDKYYLLLYKLYSSKKDALYDCNDKIFTNFECLIVNLHNF